MDQPGEKIGEVLCQLGYLTQSQLGHAIAEQKKYEHQKLGHILLELGYVTSTQLYKAICSQQQQV
ncbi:MAG: hypothetical protein ACYST9_00410 [Planctomycetota bacterium]|jgi:hypothetical protein